MRPSPVATTQRGRQPTSSHAKPHGPVPIAEAAVARQKIKQAQNACRTASQRLAQADSVDVYAQRTCRDSIDVDAVTALITLALTEHERIDVVLVTTSK